MIRIELKSANHPWKCVLKNELDQRCMIYDVVDQNKQLISESQSFLSIKGKGNLDFLRKWRVKNKNHENSYYIK